MSLTPKERQQKIEEREVAQALLNFNKKKVEEHQKLYENQQAEIAQLDRELAEPEDWVPGSDEEYEFILTNGSVTSAIRDGHSDDMRIAFNNFFQPGTGQAEAVSPVVSAWLKIYKTAFALGISGERLMDAINRHYNHNGLWSEDTNELLRLCSSEIDIVRKWNTK